VNDYLGAVDLMARGYSPFVKTANLRYRFNNAEVLNVTGWSFWHTPNDTSALAELPKEIPLNCDSTDMVTVPQVAFGNPTFEKTLVKQQRCGSELYV
jgi:hypothetical protein